MKRAALLFLPVFLAVFLCRTEAGTLKDDVLRHAVHVEAPASIVGSGVCVEHEGEVLVLTASHVVKSCFVDGKVKTVKLKWRDGSECVGTPCTWNEEWESSGLDLAFIRPETQKGLKGATLLARGAAVDEGDDCWYCGSGGGVQFSLEKSIINHANARYLRVNGNGYYGHSGSGLFVKRGDAYFLVGVITRFTNPPARHPRSPLECERQLWDFVDDLKKVKVRKKVK